MPVHRIYQAASPYNAGELAEIDYEQTADVLYLAHQNHAPTKLARAGHYDWRFVDVTFGPLIAAPTGVGGSATAPNTDAANSNNAYFPQPATYCVTAYNEETGQESRASTTVTMNNDLGLKRNYNTVNWNAVPGATAYRVYKSENTQLYGFIGTTDALTFRDDNIGPDLSEGPPIGDNPFAAAGDYPSAITFHEQRSVWGRTINRPNGIWASRSADYENMDFTRPQRADDAFAIGLVANKVNSVNQLVSHKAGLIALTSHNIFSIQGANEDYISASPPPRIRPEIARGASRLNPITIDNDILYEAAKLGDIRVIGQMLDAEGIKTDSLTVFSRHLFEDHDIVAWAWLEHPGTCIIVIRDDGKAVCLTWDRSQEVYGWTVYETDGFFRDVCVITEGGEDRAYFKIERTVQGVQKFYIERMASELWEDQDYACYLDCAKTFVNAAPTDYVNHLEHLEGREVVAWADGAEITGLSVLGGALTLPVPATVVTVGLPFTAQIETLPLAMQTGSGWSVSRPQQAAKVVLRVVDSRNIQAGVNEANLFEVKQRNLEGYDNPMDLLTGDLNVEMAGTSGNETVVIVRSTAPAPMHIAGVLIEPSAGNLD